MTRVRTVLGSFRFRIIFAFGAVVIIALALVLASLPRLLDAYFASQDQSDLDDRAALMAKLVVEQLDRCVLHPIRLDGGGLEFGRTGIGAHREADGLGFFRRELLTGREPS